ncbi:IS30 family transposase [Baaleninema simplex]|uniref:IS30 family transposase n=1 Tax=Baaleninema simplex TaxID=2862350 RepID=UPI00034633DE|nr:IS30 family transposase [Baaleninema simplex]
MSHHHLTPSERVEIYKLFTQENCSRGEIACRLGRDKGTISRELRRNATEEGLYLPDTAQKKAEERRQNAKEKFQKVSEETVEEIRQGLQQYHSPEQIVGRRKREEKETVSHETIYQMIYHDYNGLASCSKYLRRERPKRRLRQASPSKRGRIPNRVGIENRPPIADLKVEIGHWESDTMIGGHHAGVLVTHVDKASKFLVANLAKNKTAKAINAVTIEEFSYLPSSHHKTLTFDNGKEFSGHEELAQKLGVSCYFANPYHSWERGLNEHTNGMLRQFFPKGTNFKILSPDAVKKAVDLLNDRPRKSLDYRTPSEVFYSQRSETVAFQT